MEFIAGVESELSARSIALTIQLVRDVEDEIEVYRRWWGERRVDGVLMVDLRVDDPRVPELVSLGLPAVVVGGPVGKWRSTGGLARRSSVVVIEAVRYLAALGHTRIARVAGVSQFVHTTQRTEAISSASRRSSGSRPRSSRPTTRPRAAPARHGSSSRRRSRRARSSTTATCSPSPAWESRSSMGFAVPDDVSIVGWDDSLISQVVHPPLDRDHARHRRLRRHRDPAPPRGHRGPARSEDKETLRGELTPRGSTGPRSGHGGGLSAALRRAPESPGLPDLSPPG